ncbi:MAG TPA: hypothetical protein EYG71_02440 [Leucothrix sp.]|nr:hypothetical protein [Leucothrix sp.]
MLNFLIPFFFSFLIIIFVPWFTAIYDTLSKRQKKNALIKVVIIIIISIVILIEIMLRIDVFTSMTLGFRGSPVRYSDEDFFSLTIGFALVLLLINLYIAKKLKWFFSFIGISLFAIILHFLVSTSTIYVLVGKEKGISLTFIGEYQFWRLQNADMALAQNAIINKNLTHWKNYHILQHNVVGSNDDIEYWIKDVLSDGLIEFLPVLVKNREISLNDYLYYKEMAGSYPLDVFLISGSINMLYQVESLITPKERQLLYQNIIFHQLHSIKLSKGKVFNWGLIEKSLPSVTFLERPDIMRHILSHWKPKRNDKSLLKLYQLAQIYKLQNIIDSISEYVR